MVIATVFGEITKWDSWNSGKPIYLCVRRHCGGINAVNAPQALPGCSVHSRARPVVRHRNRVQSFDPETLITIRLSSPASVHLSLFLWQHR